MKQALLLISLIILIITVSGCVQTLQSFLATSNLDLIEHPEKYYNQSITIIASPSPNIRVPYYSGFKYAITERNEEGKPISMLVKYDRFYCLTCEIKGTVKSFKVCNCQSRSWISPDALYTPPYSSIEEVPWQADPVIGIDFVERCEREPEEGLTFGSRYKKKEYRCEPNSESDVYYLDVAKVKSLD